ncbi:MAG: PilZ domain-containing protein [Planctomycetota bacterium]
MDKSNPNRRRDERVPTVSRAAIEMHGGRHRALGVVFDVSQTGIGLKTRTPPEVGEWVTVSVASNHKIHHMKAEVARVEEIGLGSFFVGLRYDLAELESEPERVRERIRKDQSDRRCGERTETCKCAAIEVHSGQDQALGVVFDVSSSGIGLRTGQPPRVDDTVTIRVASEHTIHSVCARVVRVTNVDQSAFLVGLRYDAPGLQVDPFVREVLGRSVEE